MSDWVIDLRAQGFDDSYAVVADVAVVLRRPRALEVAAELRELFIDSGPSRPAAGADGAREAEDVRDCDSSSISSSCVSSKRSLQRSRLACHEPYASLRSQ